MSEIYVDTDRLFERLKAGIDVKGSVESDAADLMRHASLLAGKLRDLGNTEDAEAVLSCAEQIKALSGCITEVCDFDREAIKKYSIALSKIDDMVSGIEF